MTIASLNELIGAAKQRAPIKRTASRTAVANIWFTTFDLAGDPGAGTLAGGSTAAGVVPTDATAGYPIINAFGGSAVGYLTNVEFSSSVASRLLLADVLFKAGAYAFNATQTLSAQPSYSSRVPGGTDYTNTEIWIEAVTAFTGNLSVAVTYTNQDGTTGRTTGTVATGAALIVGRRLQLPLQAGDTGVRTIESVTATVATAGTFNVLVLRPLWTGRVVAANFGDLHDYLRIGMPQIFDNSALEISVAADSTATGLSEVMLTIANG